MKLISRKNNKVIPIRRFQYGGPYSALTWQGRGKEVEKINEGVVKGIKQVGKRTTPAGTVHSLLVGNIYPYGYDPSVVFDPFNVKNYNEFIALDLSTPGGKAAAKEIRARTKNGKRAFSNFNTSRSDESLQEMFRQRYDLLNLMSGNSQKYYSFVENPDGTYSFANQKLNNKYLQRAKAAKKRFGTSSSRNVSINKDGYNYVPMDNTNNLLNQYIINSGSDENGEYTIVYDPWDLKFTEWLPGGEFVTPVIRIKGYDKDIKDINNPESLVIKNSVYSKNGSVYYGSRKKPEPNFNYTTEGIIWNAVKDKIKNIVNK